MNAPAKIKLNFETIAEAMQREGVVHIRDWTSVSVKQGWAVHMANGDVGTGATIREAIDTAEPLKVAA